VAAAAAVLSAGWWLKRHETSLAQQRLWPKTEAQIVGYRAVREDLYVGIKGFKIVFAGDYKVRYRVAGEAHELWYRTGLIEETESQVKAQLEQRKRDFHFVVYYDPKDPSDGFAKIADQ
jgi:hypothetical protein